MQQDKLKIYCWVWNPSKIDLLQMTGILKENLCKLKIKDYPSSSQPQTPLQTPKCSPK